MKFTYFLELLLLAAVWGASFLFYRIASPVMGPVWLVTFRVAVAGLILLAVLSRSGGPADLRAYWKKLLFLGIINSAVPFLLLSYATIYLPAGLTSILNATSPLFGVVVAFIWWGERLTGARLAGFLMGFAGVVILVGWENGAVEPRPLLALLAPLLSSLLYAIGAPYSKLKLGHVSPLPVSTGSLLGATLFLLPAVPFTAPPAAPGVTVLLVALALAVLSTAAAYIMYYHLIQRIGSSKALTVTYLVPLFAVIWANIFLSEPLTAAMVSGMALILGGTAVANEIFGAKKSRST